MHSQFLLEWRITVPWQCSHPAAHNRHCAAMPLFLSPPIGKVVAARPEAAQRRSAPAELMQTIVVNPEVVCDLMEHGDGDLLDHLVLGGADAQQCVAVDGDDVGQ